MPVFRWCASDRVPIAYSRTSICSWNETRPLEQRFVTSSPILQIWRRAEKNRAQAHLLFTCAVYGSTEDTWDRGVFMELNPCATCRANSQLVNSRDVKRRSPKSRSREKKSYRVTEISPKNIDLKLHCEYDRS